MTSWIFTDIYGLKHKKNKNLEPKYKELKL